MVAKSNKNIIFVAIHQHYQYDRIQKTRHHNSTSWSTSRSERPYRGKEATAILR